MCSSDLFTDGVINFLHCGAFLGVQRPAVGPLEMGPGVSQIREGVQVGRVLRLRARIPGGPRDQKNHRRNDRCNFRKILHSEYHLM